jgi:hypothetical protein
MNENTVDKLLSNKDFMRKMADRNPHVTSPGYLSKRYGASGDVEQDMKKIAAYIGAKSYINRRQRSIINSGLITLSEVKNG